MRCRLRECIVHQITFFFTSESPRQQPSSFRFLYKGPERNSTMRGIKMVRQPRLEDPSRVLRHFPPLIKTKHFGSERSLEATSMSKFSEQNSQPVAFDRRGSFFDSKPVGLSRAVSSTFASSALCSPLDDKGLDRGGSPFRKSSRTCRPMPDIPLIPKPSGELGKPNQGGYSLQAALGMETKEYQLIQASPWLLNIFPFNSVSFARLEARSGRS